MSTTRALVLVICTLTACGQGPVPTDDASAAHDAGLLGDSDVGPPIDANSPDTTVPDAGPIMDVPLDALCGVVVHDICLALIQCLDRDYADVHECEADQICSRMTDLQMEITSGWATYDAAAAAACDARFAAAPCDFADFLFIPTVHEVLAGCPGVVTGQQGTGDPCASTLDCMPGSFCSMMAHTCPGSCMPWKGVGDACAFGTAECDPALVCRHDVCARHLVAGDACSASTSTDCLNDGLWCDTTAGQCRAPVDSGATCNWAGGPTCAAPLTCVQTLAAPGTCRMPGAAGADCGNNRDCIAPLHCYQPSTSALGTCRAQADTGGACASSSDCLDSLRCVGGLCAARAGVGEACTTDFFAEPCAAGLACDGAACRDARHTGEPCDATGVCVGSICRAGTCAARAVLGAACAADGDCASDRCSASLCVDPGVCL